MPASDPHMIKAGTVAELVFVYARDRADLDRGMTGLAAGTEGATAAFARDTEAGAVPVPLSPGRVGSHTDGGFVEVDPELLPGLYQLGLPDAMLEEGATSAILMLDLPGADVDPVRVELVRYDPFDSHAVGMRQQDQWRRHEFLRSSLSRLAALDGELAEEEERTAGS